MNSVIIKCNTCKSSEITLLMNEDGLLMLFCKNNHEVMGFDMGEEAYELVKDEFGGTNAK